MVKFQMNIYAISYLEGNEMIDKKSSYPVILVPGVLGYGDESSLSKFVPYFGTMSASAAKTIQSLGVDCYTASFTPALGVWGRACELYAQIAGGTVDYGAAYSEKNGTPRFGKTYEGFVKDWGRDNKYGNFVKVTLIAHGFGAAVARLLTYLLTYGSQKEQAAGGDVSPLFLGGNGKAVHALVTLAGNNDGTTLFDALEARFPGVQKTILNTLFTLSDWNPNAKALEEYLGRTRTNLFYEAGLDGMADLNKRLEISPDVYYFAYSAEATRDYGDLLPERRIRKYENPFTSRAYRRAKENRPELTLPALPQGLAVAPTAALIGTYKNYLADAPLATPVLHPNDGFINTDNTLAPSTEPARAYRSVNDTYPGEWYQMPIWKKGNSLGYLGVLQRPDKYRDFYVDLMKIICNLIEE